MGTTLAALIRAARIVKRFRSAADKYKDRWTIDDAVAELQARRGRHFDPALVDAFLALVPGFEPDLLQVESADARSDDQGDPGVGILTLGQSTPAGATERIHSRKTESPTRA